ncbi:MAG: cyclic nucleotide-binding domain-containing protein [Pyrinomonadaceae bacterium]
MKNQRDKRSLYPTLITVFAGIAVFIALSFVDSWWRTSLLKSIFNIAIDSKQNLTPTVSGEIITPTEKLFVGVVINLFKIFKILILMTVVVSIVKFVTQIVFDSTFSRSGQREIGSLIRTIISVIIYIVAFLIIFQSYYPNVPLAPLFTGSTILGIVVGLALQDTLGNLFSGVAIQADQGFQLGDVIAIKDQGIGVVEQISWRGVRIRTFQDKILLISNSVIGKATIEIAPKNNLNARLVYFNTIYSNSPAKVVTLVREAVRQVDNVSPKRRPIVRIRDFGNSSVDWEVKYWAINYQLVNQTDALIRQRIWYVFQREGLEFAFPTRTIYTAKQSEPETAANETADEIYERIMNVPIFAPLSDDETQLIAKSCSLRIFAPGEPIIEAGDNDRSMFIVHHGTVHVQIVENGEVRTVSTLSEGDFFGEMSLFSGESRTASVIADSETQVLEVKQYVMKPLLESNPEVARIIGEIIQERKEFLEHEEEDMLASEDVEKSGLMKSVKSFFGIE